MYLQRKELTGLDQPFDASQEALDDQAAADVGHEATKVINMNLQFIDNT
ncbi:MAG: hypothetical protein ACI3ZW_02510 [Parabacteroides sp.]